MRFRVHWKRNLVAFLIALLSAGWVLPLGRSIQLFHTWVETYVRQEPATYPFLADSSGLLGIGMIWLGLVVFGWAFVLFKRLNTSA